VDSDYITFTQTFPDTFGADYVSPDNGGLDHYNLGTTTVSLAATDSLGENSTCTTSITVKVWPGLVLGMKIECFLQGVLESHLSAPLCWASMPARILSP
jgi:hypothetical protein